MKDAFEEQTIPGADAMPAAPEEIGTPYGSLALLRQEHSALLSRCDEEQRSSAPAANAPRRKEALSSEIRRDIRLFLSQGAATGVLLNDDKERWDAQGLLNYWTSVLYRHGEDAPEAILEIFEPFQAEQQWETLSNPYLGLRSFRYADRGLFFGRDTIVQTLTQRMQQHRLLVVMGMSGSGKSSLVLAGMIPALRGETRTEAGAEANTSATAAALPWRFFEPFVPGSDPLLALAGSLLGHSTGTAQKPQDTAPGGARGGAVTNAVDGDGADWYGLRSQSPQTPAHLAAELRAAPAKVVALLRANEGVEAARPALLVIDQFEETFTLCDDEETREAFIQALVALVNDVDTPHRVTLTMRYEFRQEASQAFQSLWDKRSVFELPALLDAAELRAIIERPVWRCGVKFEDGIVDDLIAKFLGQPAVLPLLQFTLTQLWRGRKGNLITWDAYRSIGSPIQALERSADQLYAETAQEHRKWLDAILERLLKVDIGEEPLSHRLQRAELMKIGPSEEVLNALLKRLTDADLLRFTPGSTLAEDCFEIAHESLPRNWKHLSDLVAHKRRAIADRLRFRAAMELWEKHGKDPNLLLAGTALSEADHYEALDNRELAYLQASHTNIKRTKRRTYFKASLTTGLLVALVIGSWALIYVYHEKTKLQSEQLELETTQKALEKDRELLTQDQKKLNAKVAQLSTNVGQKQENIAQLAQKPFPADTKQNRPEWVIWHTAYTNGDKSASYLRHLAREELGFKDIQYQWVIRYNGDQEAGRPESVPGAHAVGLNNKSIGLCFSGDANKNPLTKAQMKTGLALCRELMRKYNIPAAHVIGHNEIKAIAHKPQRDTYCPGSNIDMKEVRAQLSQSE